MCSQSLCIWANASCMPRVVSICSVRAMRERTIPSRPRQPSTATMARMLIATSSSTRVKPRRVDKRNERAMSFNREMPDPVGPDGDLVAAVGQGQRERLVDRLAAEGDAQRIDGTGAGRVEQQGQRRILERALAQQVVVG